MNKNYFKFLFNSKKTAITFISVSYLILYLAVLLSSGFVFGSGRKEMAALATIIVIAFMLGFALIPTMLGYVHNKKAVDTYFALPISRKEQIITTEIFIDLVILVPAVILSIVSMFISLLRGDTYFIRFVLLILAFIISIIAFVAFNSATYLQAYSSFDGIVMMFAYLALPLLIMLLVQNFVGSYVYGFESIDMDSFLNLTSIVYASGNMLIELAQRTTPVITSPISYTVHYLICVLWHIVVSIFVIQKDYINRPVEKAENVSDKITAYPTLIKVFTFCILAITTTLLIDEYYEEYIIFFALIFVLYEVANCVYRRKIKIYAKDVVLFIVSTLITIVIAFACFKTEGFGLSRKYIKNPQNVIYRFYQYGDAEDDAIHKLIHESYSDAYSVSLNIDVSISHKDLEHSKEVIDLFEEIREKSIDEYYSKEFVQAGRYYTNGSLNVFNNMHEGQFGIAGDIYGPNSIQYYYPRTSYIAFSLDELKLLDKYGDVIVSFGTEKDWLDVELNELLSSK